MDNTLPYDIRLYSKLPVTFVAYFIILSIILSHNFTFGNTVKAHEIISQAIHNNTYTSSADKAELFFSKKEIQKAWDINVKSRYKNGAILTVAPGVKHIKLIKYYNSRPVKINVVEINQNLNENLVIKPSLASSKLNRKAGIKSIAQKENAIAAVNGSYFKPQSGIPLGTMMVDGNILTGPIYNRVALGITNNNEFKMDRVSLKAFIKSDSSSLKIDNINQPRMLSTYILAYNEKWGRIAPPSPKYGIQISISDNKVTAVSENQLPIPPNGYVIVGPKKMLAQFFKAKNVEINVEPNNSEWGDVVHIISGGPYLVKNGKIFIDVSDEKLNSITGYNPRTAIGYTKDNNFIMVTVDGREHASVGMTLTQLAYFMQQIGCIYAMNLDGGGSSLMYLNGNIVNTPSVKGGIAISNALVVYESKYETAYNE